MGECGHLIHCMQTSTAVNKRALWSRVVSVIEKKGKTVYFPNTFVSEGYLSGLKGLVVLY